MFLVKKLGKHNYKVGQLRVIRKGQEIFIKMKQLTHYKVEQSLLHRGACIKKRGPLFYKMELVELRSQILSDLILHNFELN